MKRVLSLLVIAALLSVPVLAGEIGSPGYVPPPAPENPLTIVTTFWSVVVDLLT